VSAYTFVTRNIWPTFDILCLHQSRLRGCIMFSTCVRLSFHLLPIMWKRFCWKWMKQLCCKLAQMVLVAGRWNDQFWGSEGRSKIKGHTTIETSFAGCWQRMFVVTLIDSRLCVWVQLMRQEWLQAGFIKYPNNEIELKQVIYKLYCVACAGVLKLTLVFFSGQSSVQESVLIRSIRYSSLFRHISA